MIEFESFLYFYDGVEEYEKEVTVYADPSVPTVQESRYCYPTIDIFLKDADGNDIDEIDGENLKRLEEEAWEEYSRECESSKYGREE